MNLVQGWPRASNPRPIVVIGAGGIVRTAHIPAYRKLGYPIAGLYDLRPESAYETAKSFALNTVFSSFDQVVKFTDAVYDIAVPGNQILNVLERLSEGSVALIQKPMGENLADACRIRMLCREKRLIAAINFQLRFSPNMLALRDLLSHKALGTVTDIEVRVVDQQPWHLWSFLKSAPRLEVLYHSIHYLDVIRFLFGDPHGVHCRSVCDPSLPEFQDTRSTIILDYGKHLRCSLTLNHTHRQGDKHRASEMKVEGTDGAALLTMGVNLDYPAGRPDALEVALGSNQWQSVPLRGSWFIEAFEGPMSNLQRFAAGEDQTLITSVEDAIRTMALVEACYESNSRQPTPIPEVD